MTPEESSGESVGRPREWMVHTSVGSTAAFHAADPAPRRAAVFHEADRPTLVLGSSQRSASVDGRVADALGVDVVGRRSGGGGVLLLPGEFVWLDLVIPTGDPLWSDDVGRAMVWVGRVWAAALASLGIDAEVRTGPFQPSPWSAQVCWAGAGTGEVMTEASPGAAPAKLVGISQRRTRGWARFQSMCHLRWRPEVVAALVAPPRPSPADLAAIAAEVPADAPSLRAALVDALPR